MLRILNCIINDRKFIDDMIESFDYTKESHHVEYCYVTDKKIIKLKFKKTDRVKVLRTDEFLGYVCDNNFNVIMLHGMNSLPHYLLQKIPQGIRVVWFAWGYDLYRYPAEEKPLIKLPLYKPLTSKAHNSDRKSYWARKKSFIYYLLHQRKIHRAINRVDFFSGVLKVEYNMMLNNSFFRAEELRFNYFKLGVDEDVKKKSLPNLGNDIVLGNSASPINNHMDVLEYLKRVDLKDRRIIMPFSYQGTPHYISQVKAYCHSNFDRTKIVFLDSFLPFNEYSELLSSCGYAIYFFEPQAGMGNIRQSLLNGRKVFLSDTSIVYQFYHSLGCIVYSVQRHLNAKELSTPLTDEQKTHNQNVILQKWSSIIFVANRYSMFEQLDRSVRA